MFIVFKMACVDKRLCNILILGFSFMLIFTAFQTCSMAEKAVLEGVKDFKGSAYTSLGILYAVFSVANWGAPSVVSIFGPKVSMVMGALMFFLFILSFLKPMVWALYLGSVLVGLGAAVLWTAQGHFLTINSDATTIARNSGIFWALLQCSLIIGNMYSYFVFKGQKTVDSEQRTTLFIALSAAAFVGSQCLWFLRSRTNTDTTEASVNASSIQTPDTPLSALKRAFQLLRTKEMLLLCFSFIYTGLELTFFSGVYGTCIAHNEHFGSNSDGLLGISGIFIGVGEILGGTLFGLLGKKTNAHGRDLIVMLGYVIHLVTFYLIFINLPPLSPIKSSDDVTYIESNQYVAILCSFLLGFGDSSFNTQIYSIIGYMYPEDSSPAFALFKFFQSVAAAVAFYYSNVLLLHWQLLILVITGTVGAMCFNVVEWENTAAIRKGYQSI